MSSNNPNVHAVVITDTSCLIILEKLAFLGLLHQLFPVVLTTPDIAEEYGNTLPDWITVITVRDRSLQEKFALTVDRGEASAIALAHEILVDHLITDDMGARKLATKLGIPVIGTLGVLIRAKESGIIPLIKPYIELMKQTDFRASDELYRTALDKAGEA